MSKLPPVPRATKHAKPSLAEQLRRLKEEHTVLDHEIDELQAQLDSKRSQLEVLDLRISVVEMIRDLQRTVIKEQDRIISHGKKARLWLLDLDPLFGHLIQLPDGKISTSEVEKVNTALNEEQRELYWLVYKGFHIHRVRLQ